MVKRGLPPDASYHRGYHLLTIRSVASMGVVALILSPARPMHNFSLDEASAGLADLGAMNPAKADLNWNATRWSFR